MVSTLVSAFVAFAGSNVDDIVLLMILRAETNGSKVKRHHIWIGQMLAIGIMVGLSLAGAFFAALLPQDFQKYIGFLGLIPIVLGIVEFVDAHRGGKKKRRARVKNRMANAPRQDDPKAEGKLGVLQVFALLFSGGVDNIGIYIPLFAAMHRGVMLVSAAMYMALAAVWCFVSLKLAGNAKIERIVQKYEGIIVPTVFILIGIFIFFDTGLL